jgi:hypothetical protein
MTGKELLAALAALTPEQLELEVISENVGSGMPFADPVSGIRVAMTDADSILAGWRGGGPFPRLEICND